MIEAQKEKIVRMQMLMDNDSTNYGIPTSKTSIGKRKYILNTRRPTEKLKVVKKDIVNTN